MFAWWSRNDAESSETDFSFDDHSDPFHGEATELEDDLDEKSSTPAIIRRSDETIEIDSQTFTFSVGFLAGGKQVVSIDAEEKVRRWQAEDGTEVGIPVRMKDNCRNLAVSRSGKWVVCGSWDGTVTVWNAESHKKVTEFKTESIDACAVDISPDETMIATGSTKCTVWVWSLPTGRRLLGPLQHDCCVVGIRFSPNGRLFATTTQDHKPSIRVYYSQDGCLLADFPIQVNSWFNQSLAWVGDSKKLFVLSIDGNVYCVDVHNGTTVSRWPIHSSNDPKCIALAPNGMFIATSANSTLSFWDATTHQQIGSVIEYSHVVWSMAISANYDIAVGGEKITLRRLWDILPASYADVIFPERVVQRMKDEKAALEETIQSLRAQEEGSNIKIAHLEQTILGLRYELAESDRRTHDLIQSLRAQEESSRTKIHHLEKTTQELRNKLANSQRAANQQRDSLNKTIKSLRAELDTQTKNSANLQNNIQELCAEIIKSQGSADLEKHNLSTRIETLRSDLHGRNESSDRRIAQLEAAVQRLGMQLGDSHDVTD